MMRPILSPRQWLSQFRRIGRAVHREVAPLLGHPEASTRLGRGASGDATYWIDEVAEQVVRRHLEALATHGVRFTLVSEECGIQDFGSPQVQVLVDPVDGSSNACRGIPCCALSLAMTEGGCLSGLQVGYVLDLVTGQVYEALRGEGAWCGKHRLETASRSTLGSLGVEVSTPSRDLRQILPLMQAASRFRCLGSTALELAFLAAGALDLVALATPTRGFDVAGGLLLVLEAGGVLTDLEGKSVEDLPLGLARTRSLLAAANAQILEQALHLLHHCGTRALD